MEKRNVYIEESLKASRQFSQVEETDYKGQTENPLHTFPPAE